MIVIMRQSFDLPVPSYIMAYIKKVFINLGESHLSWLSSIAFTLEKL